MPLQAGHSQDVITSNIKELMRSGKKPKQAIAIAIVEAQKHKKNLSTGGIVGTDGADTKDALTQALTDTNESAIESQSLPNAVLSDDAKQAILDKKKKRNFHQG